MNESERMVEEAYAAIAAVHTVPPPRVKRVTDEQHAMSTISLMQQMNIISREEALKQMGWID